MHIFSQGPTWSWRGLWLVGAACIACPAPAADGPLEVEIQEPGTRIEFCAAAMPRPHATGPVANCY